MNRNESSGCAARPAQLDIEDHKRCPPLERAPAIASYCLWAPLRCSKGRGRNLAAAGSANPATIDERPVA